MPAGKSVLRVPGVHGLHAVLRHHAVTRTGREKLPGQSADCICKSARSGCLGQQVLSDHVTLTVIPAPKHERLQEVQPRLAIALSFIHAISRGSATGTPSKVESGNSRRYGYPRKLTLVPWITAWIVCGDFAASEKSGRIRRRAS